MITYFIVPHLDLAGQALVWRVNAAPGVGHILADIGECWNQAIGIVGTDALVSPSMKDKSSLYNSNEKNQKSFISHKTTHNKSEKQKVLARTHSPPRILHKYFTYGYTVPPRRKKDCWSIGCIAISVSRNIVSQRNKQCDQIFKHFGVKNQPKL